MAPWGGTRTGGRPQRSQTLPGQLPSPKGSPRDAGGREFHRRPRWRRSLTPRNCVFGALAATALFALISSLRGLQTVPEPDRAEAVDENRAETLRVQFDILGKSDPATAADALRQAALNLYNGDAFSTVFRKATKADLAAQALLDAMLIDLASVPCKLDPTLPLEFANPKEKILFAANLRDNDHQLPHFIYNLIQTLSIIGPDRVFVSIYESNSVDNTASWLAVLRFLLDHLGVRHRIVTDGSATFWVGRDRVEFDAEIRNLALEPLWSMVPSIAFRADRIVFLSNTFFCARDVVRLLQHDKDLACGMDFQETRARTFADSLPEETVLIGLRQHLIDTYYVPMWAARMLATMDSVKNSYKRAVNTYTLGTQDVPLNFYDVWVSRDADGHAFQPHPPYVKHLYSQDRLAAGLPVPVHCCWNGMVAMRAAPFTKHGLRFRTPQHQECQAPETAMMCDDFKRLGYGDFVLDPAVRQADHVDAAKGLYDHSRVRDIDITSWQTVQQADPINYDTLAANQHTHCCALHDRKLCKTQELNANNFTDLYFRVRRDMEIQKLNAN